MPDATSPAEAVAIALLVDSSFVVATEWIHVLMEYIAPMLKRLGESYSGYQVCGLYLVRDPDTHDRL
jgi:hypothetical protein